MKRVFIKYNPYKVTTEIKMDDKPLKKNSRLNVPDQRLQEWVDNLPDILFEECSTKDFEITFHGTMLDFEDVAAVAEAANAKGISITLKHIPAKEVKDKEQAIADIFAEIQNGPFKELKQPDVVRAFEMAKSSDLEVNVVGTMSAGKSTIINSLLGQRLMPAKEEGACTATITEIKYNDSDHFAAKVYDKSGNLIETHLELTYEIMDRLNANPSVSKICAEGNIPFVISEDVSLVLVDTPGFNSSRNLEHKAAIYSMLSESSKTVVLYIMNATHLAVDDDTLLNHVAESMKVGGKQSRDRFIFVVNKLDDFKKGEDSVDSALKKVRDYLADYDIENPNIYPASALTALGIRIVLAQSDDDDDDNVYDAKGKVRKFNRNKEMFFENYAPLPASVKEIIENRLAKAKKDKDDKEQALIHSGVVSIEEAIRMYVLKYAKTAKIKNIVDTFNKRIKSVQSFETKNKESLSNRIDAIVERIDSIKAKLKSGEEAKKFMQDINAVNYDGEINNVIKNAQVEIAEQRKDFKKRKVLKKKMSFNETKNLYDEFAEFAYNLQAKVQFELEKPINIVWKCADDLLKQYIEIMKGEIPIDTSSIISRSTKTEKVTNKFIHYGIVRYKPLKFSDWFFSNMDVTRIDITKNREYIDGKQLAEKFFAPIKKQLDSSLAQDYVKKEVERIKKTFAKKFDEFGNLLNTKLEELKACETDEKKAQQKNLEEVQSRLDWLGKIQTKVNAILDI